MKRVITGLMMGAIATWVGVTLYDASVAGYLQSQAPEEWLDVTTFEVMGSPPANEPMLHVKFSTKRDLLVRGSVVSTNVDSGELYCVGQTPTRVEYAVGDYEVVTQIRNVANVDECNWPAGEYETRLTWFLTDISSGIMKQFAQTSNRFTVSAGPAVQTPSRLELLPALRFRIWSSLQLSERRYALEPAPK